MTPAGPEVVQVAGRLSAADPVAATARAWTARLTRLGRHGAVVAPDELGGPTGDRRLVVHSVDGGADLAPLLARLGDGDHVTLVHHGSSVGSDRSVLRALRPRTRRSMAATPAAREELRGLGFGSVAVVDPSLAADDLASDPDPVTVELLAGHPGPRLLCVGPLGPGRGIEVLLDAFADLLTHHAPSAVLSLCGPSSAWYRQELHRTITRQGLLACEVLAPTDDREVLARIVHAACLVQLRPAPFDPYLRAAVQRGIPVVAPLVPATSRLPDGSLVAVSPATHRSEVTSALAAALACDARRPPAAPVDGHLDAALVHALGLG